MNTGYLFVATLVAFAIAMFSVALVRDMQAQKPPPAKPPTITQ